MDLRINRIRIIRTRPSKEEAIFVYNKKCHKGSKLNQWDPVDMKAACEQLAFLLKLIAFKNSVNKNRLQLNFVIVLGGRLVNFLTGREAR